MKPKILVTERFGETSSLVKSILTGEGYDVKTAGSAEEGLEGFEQFMPDIVTTSMRLNYDMQGNELPGRMDGFAYAMRLRERGFEGPIVAMTGGSVEQYASQSEVPRHKMPQYITGVLGKPFTSDELKNRIAYVWAEHQKMR